MGAVITFPVTVRDGDDVFVERALAIARQAVADLRDLEDGRPSIQELRRDILGSYERATLRWKAGET